LHAYIQGGAKAVNEKIPSSSRVPNN